MVGIFHAFGQNVEPVKLSRQPAGDRAHAGIAFAGHCRRARSRIEKLHRSDAPRPQVMPYLAQCLWMAFHLPQRRLVAQPQQTVAHPNKMFANNGQPGFRQQKMHVGHAPVQAIFDRNHGYTGAPDLHCFDGVFKSGARQWQPIRESFAHRLMAIGARCTLKRHRTLRVCAGRFHHAIDKGLGQGRIAAAHRRSLR